MVTYIYDGDVVKKLERNVIRKKRLSTVKLARVSDMNSTFNPSALMPGPNKSRLANEGVEAYNKVLRKRANMFNSCGNRGNESGEGNVLPCEGIDKLQTIPAM